MYWVLWGGRTETHFSFGGVTNTALGFDERIWEEALVVLLGQVLTCTSLSVPASSIVA